MLLKIKALLVVSLALVASYAVVGVQVANAQTMPEKVTVFSKASVNINDITVDELYDFAGNLENDHLYYPGVVSTVLVQAGDPVDQTGSVWLQTGDFGGAPFSTYITIEKGKEGKFVRMVGQSPFLTYEAMNTFKDTKEGAQFETRSMLTTFGLTTEAQELYIQYSFSLMMAVLGKTGEIEIFTQYTNNHLF
jgi:hypothetical protein